MAQRLARLALYGAALITEYAVSSTKQLQCMLYKSYSMNAVQVERAGDVSEQVGVSQRSKCGARVRNAR